MYIKIGAQRLGESGGGAPYGSSVFLSDSYWKVFLYLSYSSIILLTSSVSLVKAASSLFWETSAYIPVQAFSIKEQDELDIVSLAHFLPWGLQIGSWACMVIMVSLPYS